MVYKPSSLEEEYFLRMDAERKRKIEEQRQKHFAAEERKNLRELHYMKCPKCGMDLFEVDYKTVKIDECPECKGIWLDAHELDTILELEKSKRTKFLGFFRK